MAKVKGTNNKTTFGKRKGGKPVKGYNKHNSKSTYHKRNASRQNG